MHEKWMSEAIRLAAQNAEGGRGGPFGAVIVQNDHWVASGVNRVTGDNDPTAHAEIVAIRAACSALGSFQLTGCVLYASCEPCPMCLAAIYWSRLDAVYFAATSDAAASAGFDDRFLYDELKKPPSERSLRAVHLAVSGAGTPFERWAEAAQKTHY